MPQELEARLQTALSQDPAEDFLRVLHFIADTEQDRSIYREALERCQTTDRFRDLALAIAKDAAVAANDPLFRNVMAAVYGKCLILDDGTKTVISLKPRSSATPGICWTLAFWVSKLPVADQSIVLQTAARFIPQGREIIHAGAQQVLRYGSQKVAIALSAVYLTYEAIMNIRAWYKGEISGKRACKSVIDAVGGVAGGVAGGWVGSSVGAAFGLVGLTMGALIGSVLGSIAGESLTESLTQVIFNVPQSVALENAYNYLGVGHTADNSIVNDCFKKLCLIHHPDKGGQKDEFIKLNCFMQIIKEAREAR